MFYGFFCAELPDLKCGAQQELSVAEFDEMAKKHLSDRCFKQLVSWDDPEAAEQLPEIYRKMRNFDAFLKLRIAENRVEKLGYTTELPIPDELHTEVDFALPAAFNADDPREREQLVDKIRWVKIDELEALHSLDFITLCAYRLRLQMSEKYRKRAEHDGNAVFEETVKNLASPIDKM